MIHSAKVASLAARAAEFGVEKVRFATNMEAVQFRKRKMVEDLIKVHFDRYKASGAELIMGEARFVSPRTITISLNDRGTRVIGRACVPEPGHARDPTCCARIG